MHTYNCTIPEPQQTNVGAQSRTYLAWTMLQAIDMHLAFLFSLDEEDNATGWNFRVLPWTGVPHTVQVLLHDPTDFYEPCLRITVKQASYRTPGDKA